VAGAPQVHIVCADTGSYEKLLMYCRWRQAGAAFKSQWRRRQQRPKKYLQSGFSIPTEFDHR
jgi:hypothetical protein